MALPPEQIDSMITQLHSFGDDGNAFDTWMNSVSIHVRAHADVGQFRTEARASWLTNNKKRVEALLREILSKPNKAEQAAIDNGAAMEDRVYRLVLKRLGIHKGDTLVVHSEHGELISIEFNDDDLPSRPKPKKKRAKRKPAKAPTKAEAEPTEEKEEPQLLHS